MNGFAAHNNNAILFFPALLIALWLVPLTIRLSFRLGSLDPPEDRRIHTVTVPRLGGLAIVAGLFLPLLLFRDVDRILGGFLAGALVVAATGFLDDVRRIPPAAKFLGEFLAASAFLGIGGVTLSDFGDFLGLGILSFGPLSLPVTAFCMVGVMNALNLSDGLDGLAGGIGAIGCVFLSVFAYLAKDWVSFSILVALLGALFGFLRYNTHPARIFMGDTGSLLLGYTLSAVAILMTRGKGTGIPLRPVTVAAVLALPIVDTLLVMFRRLRRGQNPFLPDKTHLHHRLLDMGLPHSAVVPVLYLGTALFGAQAWLLRGRPEWVQFAAVLGLCGMVYGSVSVLGRAGVAGGARRKSTERFARGEGPGRALERWMERTLTPAGWVMSAALLVPAFALGPVPRDLGILAIGSAAFVLVLFPWRSLYSRASVSYGLGFASSFCLLAALQLAPGAPRWFPGYLAVLSALLMGWVILKMRFRGHGEVALFTSFEMLLVGIALFVAAVLAPALDLGEGIRRTLLVIVMESVAFLLAMKVMARRKGASGSLIVGCFLVALTVIGVKGLGTGGQREAWPPGRKVSVTEPSTQAPPVPAAAVQGIEKSGKGTPPGEISGPPAPRTTRPARPSTNRPPRRVSGGPAVPSRGG